MAKPSSPIRAESLISDCCTPISPRAARTGCSTTPSTSSISTGLICAERRSLSASACWPNSWRTPPSASGYGERSSVVALWPRELLDLRYQAVYLPELDQTFWWRGQKLVGGMMSVQPEEIGAGTFGVVQR
jgi:hypothetical protein